MRKNKAMGEERPDWWLTTILPISIITYRLSTPMVCSPKPKKKRLEKTGHRAFCFSANRDLSQTRTWRCRTLAHFLLLKGQEATVLNIFPSPTDLAAKKPAKLHICYVSCILFLLRYCRLVSLPRKNNENHKIGLRSCSWYSTYCTEVCRLCLLPHSAQRRSVQISVHRPARAMYDTLSTFNIHLCFLIDGLSDESPKVLL